MPTLINCKGGCAGGWLQVTLQQLVQMTLQYSGTGHLPKEADAMLAGIPRGTTDPRLLPVMNTIHGYAVALAAMLVACQKLPLGAPARLLDNIYNYTRKLICQPLGQVSIQCICLELACFNPRVTCQYNRPALYLHLLHSTH